MRYLDLFISMAVQEIKSPFTYIVADYDVGINVVAKDIYFTLKSNSFKDTEAIQECDQGNFLSSIRELKKKILKYN